MCSTSTISSAIVRLLFFRPVFCRALFRSGVVAGPVCAREGQGWWVESDEEGVLRVTRVGWGRGGGVEIVRHAGERSCTDCGEGEGDRRGRKQSASLVYVVNGRDRHYSEGCRARERNDRLLGAAAPSLASNTVPAVRHTRQNNVTSPQQRYMPTDRERG